MKGLSQPQPTICGVDASFLVAEPLFTKSLEVRRRVLGEEHLDTLTSMSGLAALYMYQGKYGRAEPLFTKVLEVQRRVLGEEHPTTLATMNNLALVNRHQAKYAQAESLFTKVVEVKRRADVVDSYAGVGQSNPP